MYNNLGDAWASSLLGFLALACAPFPYLFYRYGAAIRARSKYAPNVTPATVTGQGHKEGDAQEKSSPTATTPHPQIGLPAAVGVEERSREGSMYSNLEPEWASGAGTPQAEAPREMVLEKQKVWKGEEAV